MAKAGTIFQISLSKGGVPKVAMPSVQVTTTGISGDVQATPEVHGGPERAVCLYSLECIQALQAEGHPIFPGAVGENLTLAGLDWKMVMPGSRLYLGSQVILEVTRYTSPCNTIRDAFVNGNYGRISQNQFPGWSRVYTRVIQSGKIATGDAVVLE